MIARSQSLEARVRRAVQNLIAANGLHAVAKHLGLNDEATLRLAAMAEVRRSTIDHAAKILGITPETAMAISTPLQVGEGPSAR